MMTPTGYAATVGGAVDGALSTLGFRVGGKFVASKFIMGAAGGGAGSLVERYLILLLVIKTIQMIPTLQSAQL